jgi:hypothetical protein
VILAMFHGALDSAYRIACMGYEYVAPMVRPIESIAEVIFWTVDMRSRNGPLFSRRSIANPVSELAREGAPLPSRGFWWLGVQREDRGPYSALAQPAHHCRRRSREQGKVHEQQVACFSLFSHIQNDDFSWGNQAFRSVRCCTRLAGSLGHAFDCQ